MSFIRHKFVNHPLSDSKLFDEKSFYREFLKDLHQAKSSVYVESPFITSSRVERLYPEFEKLLAEKIQIIIVTRDPVEQDELIRDQTTNEILQCLEMGVTIKLLKGFHHRKLAIIDDHILWEGSLNILSHSNSLEIMRRIDDEKLVNQMKLFLRNSV